MCFGVEPVNDPLEVFGAFVVWEGDSAFVDVPDEANKADARRERLVLFRGVGDTEVFSEVVDILETVGELGVLF